MIAPIPGASFTDRDFWEIDRLHVHVSAPLDTVNEALIERSRDRWEPFAVDTAGTVWLRRQVSALELTEREEAKPNG